ncbi:unnamed protein product [Toxocara canis]|uniref:Threonylcarbamoyl-AMP synthase n=1 Tax=Toxocara canis TaxID=6265 RepID=A0A183ULH9_TOXCA|nr:unnamed protein product [Toxocara canis]
MLPRQSHAEHSHPFGCLSLLLITRWLGCQWHGGKQPGIEPGSPRTRSGGSTTELLPPTPVWAVVTVDKRTIARLLPGPVTLVFNRSTLLPADFNKEHRTIGIRIPDHDFVRAVSRQLGAVPIVQTSANLSGATENPDFEELWPNVDLIIDGGVLKDPTGEVSRQGSTVVNLCISGTYSIIRDGW